MTGGQDGNVVVYDASLRSPKPIVSFDQGKSTVSYALGPCTDYFINHSLTALLDYVDYCIGH